VRAKGPPGLFGVRQWQVKADGPEAPSGFVLGAFVADRMRRLPSPRSVDCRAVRFSRSPGREDRLQL